MQLLTKYKENSTRNEWKDFLYSVEEYISDRKNQGSIDDAIVNGLDVFLDIPFASSSTLFLLNEENFNFTHKKSLPSKSKKESLRIYDILVNNGSIGHSLQSATLANYNDLENENKKNHCIVIPLFVPTGVLGVVLVTLNDLPQNINQIFLKICLLFGNLFASSLDNLLLFKHLNNTKEILEQKVAARTMHLAHSKRELNAIIDSVNTGILIINHKDNKVIKTNPLALDLINSPENIVIGEDYRNLLKSELDDKNINASFESTLTRSDGTSLPILRTVSILKTGRSEFRIESFVDISERKKAELALKATNELLELKVQERTEDLQLLVHKLMEEIKQREAAETEVRNMLTREKELNELKSQFVSLISHEFRTPLTIIRSSAQMGRKFDSKLTSEEKEEYSERIIRTVDYLKDMIDDVIFIGRSESIGIKPSPLLLDLNNFFTQVIEDIQNSLEVKRNIELIFDTTCTTFHIDKKLLRHITMNLLNNSIKYSDEGSQILIVVKECDKNITFSIIDNGIGIRKDDQEKIFEAFYRGKNVGSVNGTGLGMSVVLKSLEILKGKIDISSKLNFGTTFTVTIPRMKIK